MRVQLSSSLHFYLLYLLLSSSDGDDAKQRIFLGRLLEALVVQCVGSEKKRFQLGDVQSDVILPLCLHATLSSLTNTTACRRRFVICLLAHVS